ncbi:MAG: hypothetical protein ACRDK5_06095 [Solirubrobacterales bacterium]
MRATFLIVPALAAFAALLPLLSRRRVGRHHPVVRNRDGRRNAEAERRARELLRDTAGEEAYAMYSQLGFVATEPGTEDDYGNPRYGYLIYPHRPIVAYDADSGELLSEYCVRFPDGSDPEAGEWLPDADDVLAKWMALHGDERRLIGEANMHLPGRQLDPGMVRRDLQVARAWTARRAGETMAAT